jgi:acetylornithine deacetylase/succinyl-diaminopimelate desuccinylase-like protein
LILAPENVKNRGVTGAIDERVTGQVTELVQTLIRNACVNDGSPESGGEARSVDVLANVLEGGGLDLQRYEPAPGRASLVARIEGRDPSAPTLMLMGHTDVVPVNAPAWRHDPFGGEVIDGEVWGRGAIDMLNLTASMAVATRRLADSGFRPDGTLIYLAVADEEAMGAFGAEHLATNEADAVRADYVITESGGFPFPTAGGTRLPVIVAEKGPYWTRLIVKGTPGHGSMPHGTDNALIKAAEVVRRLAEYTPEIRITEMWRHFVEGLGLPEEMSAPLLRAEGFDEAVAMFPAGLQRMAHACTRTTIAPTMLRGGAKLNIIPDHVELQVDMRMLPGQSVDDTRAVLRDALGDLAGAVEIQEVSSHEATNSPTDTPLWDALQRVSRQFYDDATLLPMLMPGTTDARFFRELGATAYGYGMFSTRLGFEELATMGHGDNERVDVETLGLCAQLWDGVAKEFLCG